MQYFYKILTICIISILNSALILAEDKNYGALIERQAAQIKNLQIKLDKLEQQVINLSNTRIEDKFTTDSKKSTTTDNNIFIDPKQDKENYENALAKLKKGQLEEAEAKFSAFIINYPNSKFQSNAIFWYAESFYLQENFNPAAINFLKSYKHSPKGPKADDALLKLALSLNKLNKNEEACKMLVKLDKEFPSRAEIAKVRSKELKETLKCK